MVAAAPKKEGVVTRTVEGTKLTLWKLLGALVMRPKTDAKGQAHMAISLTKLQKLISLAMAVVLFIVMVLLWVIKPEMVAELAKASDPIPDSMLYTLWGLLGLTGVNMVSGAIATKK